MRDSRQTYPKSKYAFESVLRFFFLEGECVVYSRCEGSAWIVQVQYSSRCQSDSHHIIWSGFFVCARHARLNIVAYTWYMIASWLSSELDVASWWNVFRQCLLNGWTHTTRYAYLHIISWVRRTRHISGFLSWPSYTIAFGGRDRGRGRNVKYTREEPGVTPSPHNYHGRRNELQ